MPERQLTIVSNRSLATLMERLARDLRDAPLPPLAEELIVVQSQGMERWMRLELARRQGCAASLRIPFPAAFCHWLAEEVERAMLEAGRALPDAAAEFDRDVLTWRILALLESGIASDGDFAPLAGFLADDDARKHMGLAARIAERFDDYQLYRADVLLAWERGELPLGGAPHERWQAALWRRLCAGTGPRHLARRFTSLIEHLERGGGVPDGLPPRVSVFGVSSLPPLFLDLLRSLARHVPVRMYVAAPPRAAWPGRAGTGAPPIGNPLLAACGSQLRTLLELAAPDATWEELPDDGEEDGPSPSTCLHVLRDDVCRGIARGTSDAPPLPLAPDDDSLRVHVCHSPLREMEVVRDQLLAAFAADPTLRPHDVLVLVPDADLYAPYIDAVFGAGEPELPALPFHVADRSIAREHSLVGAFLQLLRLAGGRRSATEILGLMDVPAIRRAAGLADGSAETLLAWVRATRIHWGKDGEERGALWGLPRVDAHSWRAGIDRLLMGYATGPVDALVAGILPHGGQTVGDPELLGRFALWLDRLFAALDDWRAPRTLREWSDALRAALDQFYEGTHEDEERSLDVLRARVAELARVQDLSGCDRAFELGVVRDWLEQTLADDSFGTGFLLGGITFCAFKPMRSIPFRVIVVAGLDDATFPRRARRSAFDLQLLYPRPGDRDLRSDDRQLFLDTLLAARDRLILTYVGRSARDNAERAPSVVLAELLDRIDASFRVDPGGAGPPAPARALVVVEHRLQPFSPAYFAPDGEGDPRLFSYSRASASACEAARGTRERVAPFVADPLPASGDDRAADDGATALSLGDLIDCWTNPSRHFCRRVLGIALPEREVPEDDVEPLVVGPLDRHRVHDRMTRRHLRGTRERDGELAELAARGELPPAALGRAWHRRLNAEIAPLLDRIGEPGWLEPLPVELRGESWLLTGRIDALTARGRLQVRPGRTRPRDLVHAWITHLALNAQACVAGWDGALETRLVTLDETVLFPPVGDAVEQLAALVEGHRLALRAPLPVFERASHAYVAQGTKARARKDPLAAARDAYALEPQGGWGAAGDASDPYVRLCFRGIDPFEDCEEDFRHWSETLWTRALGCAQRERA